MKTLRILLVIMTALVTQIAGARTATSNDPLIEALIQKESSGNDHAIGDKQLKHKAYGPLQIRKDCVDDVNERYRTHYRPEDMYGNRSLSVWVCNKYLERYATKKLIGRMPTNEDRARIWNGGPYGWKSKTTIGYWAAVQKILAKRK